MSASVWAEKGNPVLVRLGNTRTCTSRDNGYEPALVLPAGNHVRGIEIHSEVDAVTVAFRSPRNIAHLQHECERRGLGRPAPESFYRHMQRALQVDQGTMPPDAVPDYAAYVREMVATLNARLLAMIVPLMQANKMGFVQFQKDLSYRQILDVTPCMADECSKTCARTEHPYYNGI